mmetsp:Transcript_72629/g.151676  ORF Transcript_72629/g.151676 Transcript_72629/m.151676 type:complete len:268 (+) Transcript_72629:143-946(+)|eukprot:CAMPEP_0181326916 /NCGR_PEP_ID=MMETSP1101-20121128/21785_1 /TAXON_ID=46948 /ORGANISM="Rhodomonas abbreviata, Strain Caron Lab Isolate" /LENGTH=267 /DNA_ID=CAMNT_0023435465 /DNA_START=143 /DNA_END=946 /DNA_ORIENTATION=+
MSQRVLRSLATLAAIAAPTSAFMGAMPLVPSALRSVPISRAYPLAAARVHGMRNLATTTKMGQAVNVPITVTGNNLELTPAIKDYCTDKMSNALSKVGRKVTRCDVHLVVDKNPAVEKPATAEVVVSVKGTVLRASKKTHDMYASIDEVSDSMKRKLRKYKERIIDAHRQGKPEAEGYDDTDIEGFIAFNAEIEEEMSQAGESLVPAVDMSVVKKKAFPMEPITVAEAVLCLDYIDHDFYVFKNADTGKVSVVYKRNSDGVGLIEPE